MSSTGRCGLIRPSGRKMQPLSYPPPPKIRQKSPSKNDTAMPSPGRSSPRPRVSSLIVVFYWIGTWWCGLIRPPSRKLQPLSSPPPPPKIRQKSPSKINAATPSPGRSSTRPRVRSLIVVLLMSWTGRCGLICPPGCNLMKPLNPPAGQKFDKNPLLKTMPPCHPPAVAAPDPTYTR